MAAKVEFLTRTPLAERLGVDVRTIDRWVADGMPKRTISGRAQFAWHDCRKWWEAKIREDERATRHAAGDEDKKTEMAELRLRALRAEAEEAELNLAHRRGELVPRAFMRDEFRRIATGLRARLLALPQSWAARLGVCTSTVDRQLMLQDAINEVMPQLRDLVKEEAPDPTAGAVSS
jgi:phage terminase Nu1 subunit (DNA packaging protein)